MRYIVKKGAKAFLDNSLRSEGYVHQVEKAYQTWPAWAEPEGARVAEDAPQKSAPKAKGKKGAPVPDERPISPNVPADPAEFMDTDLLENPTVVL